MIGEDSARGFFSGGEVTIDLGFALRCDVEISSGGLDAACGGAGLLPLRGCKGVTTAFGFDIFTGARAEFACTLALCFQTSLIGFAAAPVARGTLASGLLLLRLF